ncbi:MAG: glycoside hydrolase [Sphingomonadales bacterium]|nr:glycoside hydrolase [Sphingomonadales bacterium]
MAGSPGWSQTGGPWVKPEQAMKRLVWTETLVDGGAPIAISLAQPSDAIGPFGSRHVEAKWTAETHPTIPKSYYRDIMALAYRVDWDDEPLNKHAVIRSNRGPLNGATLSDGDLESAVKLPYDREKDSSVWIEYSFNEPRTVRSFTLFMAGGHGQFGEAPKPAGWIETSDDGVTYTRLAELPGINLIPRTIMVPQVTARHFRFQFRIDPNARLTSGFFGDRPFRTEHEIIQLELREAPRVHLYEDKAGFWDEPSLHELASPPVAANLTIKPENVIDVTSFMAADGKLDWTPPAGRWQILRIGYGLTGETNGPTLDELTGLEVDKLNRVHVRAYVNDYLSAYEAALGTGLMGKRGLTHLLTDSYEAGPANWTDDMEAKFKAFAGYDLRPWMPVLAGHVVGSAEESDRFLWDFRNLLGQLMAEEHYGEISRALHDRGMKRYGEGHEDRRAFIGDGMQAKKYADIPMGATWMPQVDFPHSSRLMRDADIRESASVAHIYGQNIAAAECFTASGRPRGSHAYAPHHLKPVADRMMANGLNRVVVHTSVHQPDDSIGPGLSLGQFGQWFTRKETWAGMAHAWIGYLSRSSHLLQQGQFAADVAYFYGQGDNVTELFVKRAPEVPDGYAYDFINADAILNDVTAKDGKIYAPSGVSYRALVIDPSVTQMTLPVLKKLTAFAAAGVSIIGPKPLSTPSKADDQALFTRMAGALWQNGAKAAPSAEALPLVFPPAFTYSATGNNAPVSFVHRVLKEGELFFICAENAEPQKLEASFHITGRAPEIWDAITGTISDAAYHIEGDRTIVPLHLPPNGAQFVVFRQSAKSQKRSVKRRDAQEIAALSGGWSVTFRHPGPDDKTVPLAIDTLKSWTELEEPALKFFPGQPAIHVRLRLLINPKAASCLIWAVSGKLPRFL